MGDPVEPAPTGEATPLSALIADELARPVAASAERIAQAIRERHRGAVAAVVFYGSCLRKQTDEGVLDFYALVDDYPSAYASRVLAAANAWLPPNVFYLETDPDPTQPGSTEPLRSKYAVVSLADFARAATPAFIRPGIWARFCQPSAIAWARDAAARGRVAGAVEESVRTLLRSVLPLLPFEQGADGYSRWRFDPEALWRRAFSETYSAEMRPESDASVQGVYDAATERYREVSLAGLRDLASEGWLGLREDGAGLEIEMDEALRARAAGRWRRRRPLAKALYAAQLLKSAATFGDWLPYALWKLQRHTGTKLVPSERQRRHPFLWGWPLVLRVLWRRELR